VKALYKPFERQWKERLWLHSSRVLCIFKALHKPLEETLWYLFVRKTAIGHTLAYDFHPEI
jgi:hypothetical protein